MIIYRAQVIFAVAPSCDGLRIVLHRVPPHQYSTEHAQLTHSVFVREIGSEGTLSWPMTDVHQTIL